MRLRLAACGVRPISNLVDVTNYVLLELGHPLHAFDLDKLSGDIVVRRARPGEGMKTLDGADRTLQPDDIVIADQRGPVALAGVMGGAGSEVSGSTRQVLLEAATFDPRSVRRTSKRLGLLSEASYRFERGRRRGGGPAGGRAGRPPAGRPGWRQRRAPRWSIATRGRRRAGRPRSAVAQLRRLSGLPLDANAAAIELRKVAAGPNAVTVAGRGRSRAGGPGSAQLPPRPGTARGPGRGGAAPGPALRVARAHRARPGQRARRRPTRRTRRTACATCWPAPACRRSSAGDSCRARALAAIAGDRAELADGVAVKNPISADYEVMRTSLLPGPGRRGWAQPGPRAWRTCGCSRWGRWSTKNRAGAEPLQSEWAALLMTGRRGGWLKPGEPLDFFDLKRVVLAACGSFGIEPRVRPRAAMSLTCIPEWPPRCSCRAAGSARPASCTRWPRAGWGSRRALSTPSWRWTRWRGQQSPCAAWPPPRFPAVTRDLSFWIDVHVSAAQQRAALLGAGEPLLARSAGARGLPRSRSTSPPARRGCSGA